MNRNIAQWTIVTLYSDSLLLWFWINLSY